VNFINLKKVYTTKSTCLTKGKNIFMDSELSSIWRAVNIFNFNQPSFNSWLPVTGLTHKTQADM